MKQRYTEIFSNLHVITGVGSTTEMKAIEGHAAARTVHVVDFSSYTMPQIIALADEIKNNLRGAKLSTRCGDREDVWRTRYSKIKIRHGHQGFSITARLDIARAYGAFKAEVKSVLNTTSTTTIAGYGPMFLSLALARTDETSVIVELLDKAYGEQVPHGYGAPVHVWASHKNLWGEHPDRLGAGMRVVLTNIEGYHCLTFICR